MTPGPTGHAKADEHSATTSRATCRRNGHAAGIAARDPGWTGGDEFPDLATDDRAQRAKDAITAGVAEPSEAQELLWASHRYALLVVLQAMDAAGKDSVIKHVMSTARTTRKSSR